MPALQNPRHEPTEYRRDHADQHRLIDRSVRPGPEPAIRFPMCSEEIARDTWWLGDPQRE